MPSILLFFPLPSFRFLCFFFSKEKRKLRKKENQGKRKINNRAPVLFFLFVVSSYKTQKQEKDNKNGCMISRSVWCGVSFFLCFVRVGTIVGFTT